MHIILTQNSEALWQSLEHKVTFLKQCSSYYEPCQEIEAIETHMSWVFLTDQYAYKLKKPVHFSYLDFSTPHKRLRSLQREFILNQALAPNVYLDILPLQQNRKKGFYPVGLFQEGDTVDWLLKMKRFPQNKTLDKTIVEHNTDHSQLIKAAEKLMQFYRQSPPLFFKPRVYLKYFKNNLLDNLNELQQPQYELDPIFLKDMHCALVKKLNELSQSISHRILQGRIIECHGDLRPEHICLISPPIIIDRLEFDRELRIMDPLEELSYLYVECQNLGAPEIGQLFYQVYEQNLGDTPNPDLLILYQSYRACLKAKLAAWHLDDVRIENQQKWYDKAKSYLDLSTTLFRG